MKKKVIIIVVIILILMLIPVRYRLKDGGSIVYKSMLYSVTKVHAINLESATGYEDGWKIKIFGIQVYNVVNVYVEASDNFIIIDKTKQIDNFVCASALDPFYEDDKCIYSYGCIMSDYVIVKYSNGKEETVKEALQNNKIKIEDLDKFNIKYYKQEK